MSLVVEDGTGKADSESLVSVAEATTYHAAQGNAAWAALATDAVREQLLRKATTYMQAAYRERWAGGRVYTTQALDWPRSNVPMRDGPGYGRWASFYSFTVVPLIVRQACAELALKAAAGDLNPDLTRGVLKEAVGSLSVEYDPASPQATRYRSIDMLLEPLFAAGGSGIRVMRG